MPHAFSEGPKNPEAWTELRAKLDAVATLHNGNVPLHGRLLAQWLHFAFPRECPYPHAAGTLNPQTPARWEAAGGSIASEDEIQQCLASEVAREAPSPDAGSDMW